MSSLTKIITSILTKFILLFPYHQVHAALSKPGISQPIYPNIAYTGSRVLDHGIPGYYDNITSVTFYGHVSQDGSGTVWTVDRVRHFVLTVSYGSNIFFEVLKQFFIFEKI
tara:strand:- start:83 stop:415 length:333 start_codon:yes stop_codon:yes gene_type:complete